MKRDKKPWGIYPVIYLILLGFIFHGCSKKLPLDDRFFGSWSISDAGGDLSLTFDPNGEWNSNIRAEDMAENTDKKMSKAKGAWRVEENRLIMTVIEAEKDSFWKQGQNAVYDIVRVKKLDLQLKGPEGKIIEWKRVKADKGESDTAEFVTLNLGPMVVNLFKEKPKSKERYLCIDMDLILEDSNYEKPPFQIHPKIKEATIFYLSSLTYNDVNRIDKLSVVQDNVKNILNPYIDGTIRGVMIKKIVVTASKKTVEDFRAEYLNIEEKEKENEKKHEKSKKE